MSMRDLTVQIEQLRQCNFPGRVPDSWEVGWDKAIDTVLALVDAGLESERRDAFKAGFDAGALDDYGCVPEHVPYESREEIEAACEAAVAAYLAARAKESR